MSQPTLGSMLFSSVKTLLAAAIKTCLIAFAWLCILVGNTLSKLGEAIQKIIIRRS